MNKKVVLASGNAGKLAEFGQSLAPLGIELIAQSQFVAAEVEETGLSFVENAILKARHACAASGLPALADDSGLEVDALQGQPGIYSSRFAGVSGP
ncbi:MAG TPA: non-canonical purine NTP pyrophosphatase, partial [Oceanospirillaceae bacterium]|nr:non-canonical purine NTP pyrophosphatase [Oceanospirillaceae bacterium]